VDAGDTGNPIPRPLQDRADGVGIGHGRQPAVDGKAFKGSAQTKVCDLHRLHCSYFDNATFDDYSPFAQ
jgi:hypothetical protein